jgi:hypothetical protein
VLEDDEDEENLECWPSSGERPALRPGDPAARSGLSELLAEPYCDQSVGRDKVGGVRRRVSYEAVFVNKLLVY